MRRIQSSRFTIDVNTHFEIETKLHFVKTSEKTTNSIFNIDEAEHPPTTCNTQLSSKNQKINGLRRKLKNMNEFC